MEDEKKEKELKIMKTDASAVIYDEQGNTISSGEVETHVDASKVDGTLSHSLDEPQDDSFDVPLRPVEKKRLHWTGKTCMCTDSIICCFLILR